MGSCPSRKLEAVYRLGFQEQSPSSQAGHDARHPKCLIISSDAFTTPFEGYKQPLFCLHYLV